MNFLEKLNRQIEEQTRNGRKDVYVNTTDLRKLNPKNGWGSYDGLLATLQEMRICCENNPDGIINVN